MTGMTFQRTLPWWLILVGLAALKWPQWSALIGGADPWPWLESRIQWWVILTMLCVGILLPREQVHVLRARWWAIVFGVFVQYTTMPLLAWCCGRAFQLPPDAFLGTIIVGCVPGAMASNVLTLNARGHVGYSISLTTAATLISPVAVPLGLLLGLGRWHYDPILTRSSLYVATTVVTPVVVGHLLGRALTARMYRQVATVTANGAILLIIGAVVAKSRGSFASLDWQLVMALLAVNIGGYIAGYTAGQVVGLSHTMRRALTIEIGMQNAGVGAALAAHLFPDHPHVAVAPALYSFGCMMTATLLSDYWSRRPPPPDGS